jgi:uncharacterized membrane protein
MLILLILLGIVFYVGYNLSVAQAGGNIDARLNAAIVNTIATLLPLTYYVFLVMNRPAQVIKANPRGYLFSVLGGICIAVFSVTIVLIFQVGGNVSYVIPLIYGCSIMLASLVGIFVLKEPVNIFSLLGFILITCGIFLMAYSKVSSSKLI